MIWHFAAVAVAAAIAASVGTWRVQEWRHAAIRAEEIDAAAEEDRLRRQAAERNAERNDHATNQALARAHAAALLARGDLERLRLAAGAVASDSAASAAGCGDDGRLRSLTRLLAEGAELAEEGGRRVEQLAAEKASLQRHATEER